MKLSMLFEDIGLSIVRTNAVDVSIKETGALRGQYVENPRLGTGEFNRFHVHEFSDGTLLVEIPDVLVASDNEDNVLVKDGKAFVEPSQRPNWMTRYIRIVTASYGKRDRNIKGHPSDLDAIRLALKEMDDEGRLVNKLPR